MVTATVDEGTIIIIIILEANEEVTGRRLVFRVMVPSVHPEEDLLVPLEMALSVHLEEDLGALLEMAPLVALVEDCMAGVAAAMLAVVVQQVLHNRKMIGVAMSGLK